MITKKSLLSIIALTVTLVLAFTFMHLMSLFTISKWVGVSVGIVLAGVALIITIAFHKTKFKVRFNPALVAVICINGVASGLALSSLFVYLGRFPRVWQSVCVAAVLIALSVLYCVLNNNSVMRSHFVSGIIMFAAPLAIVAIFLIVYNGSAVFVLAGMGLIPLIVFIISMPLQAKNEKEHFKNIAYCSFAASVIVVVVVLLIISAGDGADFGSGGDGGGANKGKKIKPDDYNPYDYYNTKSSTVWETPDLRGL